MLPTDNEGGTDPSITNIYSLITTQESPVALSLNMVSNSILTPRDKHFHISACLRSLIKLTRCRDVRKIVWRPVLPNNKKFYQCRKREKIVCPPCIFLPQFYSVAGRHGSCGSAALCLLHAVHISAINS